MLRALPLLLACSLGGCYTQDIYSPELEHRLDLETCERLRKITLVYMPEWKIRRRSCQETAREYCRAIGQAPNCPSAISVVDSL